MHYTLLNSSSTCVHSLCPNQILLDGFVETNKRLCPNIPLVFSRGIGHLMGDVDQGQQSALKIVLMQLIITIWKVRD